MKPINLNKSMKKHLLRVFCAVAVAAIAGYSVYPPEGDTSVELDIG